MEVLGSISGSCRAASGYRKCKQYFPGLSESLILSWALLEAAPFWELLPRSALRRVPRQSFGMYIGALNHEL